MSASRTMSCARIEAQNAQAQVATDDLRQHVPPDVLERGRVLVGEPEEAHVALAAEPLQFVRRTSSRRDGASASRTSTGRSRCRCAGSRARTARPRRGPGRTPGSVPVVDQLPADRVGVEVVDRRTGRVHHHDVPAPPGDTRHARQSPAPRPRPTRRRPASASTSATAVASPSPRTITSTSGCCARISRADRSGARRRRR